MTKKVKKKTKKKVTKKNPVKKDKKPKPKIALGVSYNDGLDWHYPFESFSSEDDEDECPHCGTRLW